MELILILLAILLLFGYKKLPDASRSLGRSMRIFKGEMKGMKSDDVQTRAEAETLRPTLAPEPQTQYQAPHAPAAQTQPVPQPRVDDPR